MKNKKEICEICNDKGWLHTLNTNTETMEIQKCDDCGVFKTDEQALEHVVKLAIASLGMRELLKDILEWDGILQHSKIRIKKVIESSDL